MRRDDNLITALTDEQKESYENLVAYVGNAVTNTKEANRDLYAEGIKECYKLLDKPEPKIMWCSGPIEANELAGCVFGDPINLDYPISKKRRVFPNKIVSASLNNDLNNTFRPMQRFQSSLVNIGDFRSPFRHLAAYGSPSLTEDMLTKWACDEFSLELDAVCKTTLKTVGAGWHTYFNTVIIVTEPPSTIEVDANWFSHCETGPAVVARDGTEFWRWHGVPVPPKVILFPDSITIDEIHRESNNDVRSIMVERITWARYLSESGSVCISQRDNVVEGTKEALYETPFNECRFVCSCVTGRMFTLGLPPTIRTCEEAQNWLRANRKFNIIAAT